ncbi:MAG: polysaccharide biosynthesis tyrosine autokinase [Vicinamibacterales bacterium]
MSGNERSGMAGLVRMVRRHALPMAVVFVLAAVLVAVVAELQWRERVKVTALDASVRPVAVTPEGSRAADLLEALGPIFDAELASTRQQIAERDAALAALDQEAAAQGANDPAARAARLVGARRRVSALAEAIARDRAALSTLQSTPPAATVAVARPVHPEVVAAEQSANEAEARLRELERRLMPQHPDVVKQRGIVRERQAEASAVAASHPPSPPAVSTAQADDNEDRAREGRMLLERIASQEVEQRRSAAIVAALEAGSSVVAAMVEERGRLLRERDSLQAVYAALEAKQTDLRKRASAMAEAAAAQRAPDPSPAVTPSLAGHTSPTRRITAPWLAFGAGGALLLAFLVGFVLDARDTSIHDVSDLRSVTQAALLVSVSEIVATNKSPTTTEREISTLPEPSSPTLIWHPRTPRRAIEQYRRLAQALRRIRVDRQTRVIGITSALPGEGKTLTAVNLAVSFAESYRQRVLIIDADLRRPAVSRLLSLAPQEGLADWLRHDDGRECPMVRLTSRLSVIPAGTPGNDPTPLLTSLRMALLIAAARADFDWVVVDTPPTGLIADAGAIEGSLDGFLVVAAAGRTNGQALRQAIDALGTDRVLGVILNRVRKSAGSESDVYSDYYATRSTPQ